MEAVSIKGPRQHEQAGVGLLQEIFSKEDQRMVFRGDSKMIAWGQD